MRNVLIIGAGGVGSAVTHKCAQHNDALGDICLASRTLSKCERIVEAVDEKNNLKTPEGKLSAMQVDAKDVGAVAELITRNKTSIVLNAGSPHCNLAIMEACLRTGAHYLDTAVYEKEGSFNVPPPWYANNEWKYRDRFSAAAVTGILGIGFDPGAVNAFCAYAYKHLIDDIESIDIMDVNADAVEAALREAGVSIMLHGHTHRPAVHELTVDGKPAQRIVLGDWYEQGSVVRWDEQGPVLASMAR